MTHQHGEIKSMTASGKSRRLFLGACLGVGVVAAAGAVGVELIDHGVIPGKSELDAVDGACDLPSADLDAYAAAGPEVSGRFHSAARNRSVGYTIGYPPGRGPGAPDRPGSPGRIRAL